MHLYLAFRFYMESFASMLDVYRKILVKRLRWKVKREEREKESLRVSLFSYTPCIYYCRCATAIAAIVGEYP